MPTADDIITDLNRAKIMSKLDLSHAYHQLMLSEGSRPITNFLGKQTAVSLQEIILWYLFCIGNVQAHNYAGIKQPTWLPKHLQ